MLGSGVSSLAIWTAFNTMTTAIVRRLNWSLRIAWTRVVDPTTVFATVGTSLVDGLHIIQGDGGFVGLLDQYTYFDETDRVLRLEYQRKVIEPLGGIATALGDVVLDNTDGRFSPNKNATIGTALIPNRPVKMSIGFDNVLSLTQLVQIFEGFTRQPKENKLNRTISISSFDFIDYLNRFTLSVNMYQDQRTDQIIEDILSTEVGLSATQYELDTGINTIGFAYFPSGTKAGDAIKQLVESEEGFFFCDENGKLRFFNRRKFQTSPYNAPIWDITPDDMLSWEEDDSVEIINKVVITASPREVQAEAEVWDAGTVYEIQPGETLEVWATFEDPIFDVTTPATPTDYVANTAADGSGTDISASIAIVVTEFATSALLEITNNSIFSGFLTTLKLRGQAATVSTTIQEQYEDATSISKFGENQLEIDNDFVDDNDFAFYLARALVRKYKDPKKRIKVVIQGAPQLQLMDRVTVLSPNAENLAPNPSFEANTTYWSLVLTGVNGTLTQEISQYAAHGIRVGLVDITAL